MVVKKLLALGLVYATLIGLAQADGFYVGGDVGRAKIKDFELANGHSSKEEKDTVYGVFVGYDFDQYFGVQGGYRWLGEYTEKLVGGPDSFKGTFKAKALDAAVIGHLPLTDMVNIYAKAGFTYWDVDAKANVEFAGASIRKSVSEDGWSPQAGVGVEVKLGQVALMAGYQRDWDIGDKKNTDRFDIDQFNLGARYLFN